MATIDPDCMVCRGYEIEAKRLVARVAELEQEVEQLRKPNFFWDDRCLDFAVDSIEEAVAYDDIGDIIPLRPIHELPTVWVLVGEDVCTLHPNHESAEARKQKSK
jgi:hypothetical protein